jgi:hypothetical protein
LKIARQGNLRAQMRERQRRNRASMPALRQRYPQLGSLRLEFEFSDGGRFTPTPQVTVMHPPAIAYFCFPCPFSDCDGEFDLAAPIGVMLRDGQAHCEGQVRCQGHRSLDGKSGMPCVLMLEYSIEARGA